MMDATHEINAFWMVDKAIITMQTSIVIFMASIMHQLTISSSFFIIITQKIWP